MTVSVAMATYNGEEYIEKQIDSILNQSCAPNQIVVCDDCSCDNTLNILYDYAKKSKDITWRIIRNEENQGYIKTFFRAIADAYGDIIILSDQDDVWDKEKIQFYVDSFSNNDEILSIHTDYAIIDQKGKLIKDNAIAYRNTLTKWGVNEFCCRLNYCGMSSAFRASIKENLLALNPEMLPTHDWTIHAIAVIRDGMFVSNRVTSYRRYTGKNVALNIDKNTRREGIKQRIEVVKTYLDYYVLLKYFAEKDDSRVDVKEIKEWISTQKNRLEYLESRNLFKWLKNIIRIKKYPSDKAYFCDVLYIIGVF